MGLLVIASFGGLAFHAISRMLFGVLGITAEDPTYPYLVALIVFLASAGGSCAAINIQGRSRRFFQFISGLTTGALLGVFYGGGVMGNDPQAAVVSAVIAGSLGAIMHLMSRTRLVTIAIYSVGGCAAYGICFLIGTRTTSLLSVQRVFMGGLLGLFALLFLGLTLKIIANIIIVLKNFAHTSWRGTNLAEASFNGTNLDTKTMIRYGIAKKAL